MNPRKSSTSSGNRFERPRYLLVEVSGAATPSPRSLEELLAHRIPGPPEQRFRFRIIVLEGSHALVAVSHLDAPSARSAWNLPALPGTAALRTVRSYGTLRKGRIWLGAHPSPGFTRSPDGPRRRRRSR